MNYEITSLPMFYVAGISIRTINKNGQAGQDIATLWHQFIQGNLANGLKDKEDSELYCVYTDYESDHDGYYTAILGCKVTSIEYLPEGFVGKPISPQKYAMFSPEGKFPTNIGETWQYIWQSDLQRVYTADFDVYNLSNGLDNAEIKVCVAVD